MFPDGLPKFPSHLELNLWCPNFKGFNIWMPKDFFIPIWPEVPRSFPKVLRKDTEGFQNIAKTCRNIPSLRIQLSVPFGV